MHNIQYQASYQQNSKIKMQRQDINCAQSELQHKYSTLNQSKSPKNVFVFRLKLFEKAKCIKGNSCILVCSSESCTENAILCGFQQCDCHLLHQKQDHQCNLIDPKSLTKRLLNRKVQSQQLQEFLDKTLNDMIDWISDLRESISYMFLKPKQKQFLMKAQNQEFQKITGKQISEMNVDIFSKRAQVDQKHYIDQIKQYWESKQKQIKNLIGGIASLDFRSKVSIALAKQAQQLKLSMSQQKILAQLKPIPSNKKFKVVLIGDQNSGKTQITERFAKDEYDPKLKSTLRNKFTAQTVIQNNFEYGIQLWDTPGQQKHRNDILSIEDAKCVIIVLDLTQSAEQIKENIKYWTQYYSQYSSFEKNVVALCGAKADKKSEQYNVQDILKQLRILINYFQVSALKGLKIKEMFTELLGDMLVIEAEKLKI